MLRACAYDSVYSVLSSAASTSWIPHTQPLLLWNINDLGLALMSLVQPSVSCMIGVLAQFHHFTQTRASCERTGHWQCINSSSQQQQQQQQHNCEG